MKTERRHELETNVLAKELARWIDLVKPYSKAGVGVLVAALVIAAVTMFVKRQGNRAEAMAWDAYYQATVGGQPHLEQLQTVADEYRGTAVEPWARIAWADGQLAFGTRVLFRQRNVGKQFLGRAIEAYRQLQENNVPEMIRQRAIYGMARAEESLSDVDAACQEYAKTDGALAELAKARATSLKKDEAKQFYDWFAQAKLAQDSGSKGAGAVGRKPVFGVDAAAASTGANGAPDHSKGAKPVRPQDSRGPDPGTSTSGTSR